jgi:NAD(P)-dependent dehydrogenase (short-subunit alcohol dehydrogenase family)
VFALDNRVILVTGGAGGIGSAIVRLLFRLGADVIAGDINEPGLKALSAEIGCRTIIMDMTSEAAVRQALSGLDLWGLVNCSGWAGPLETPMDVEPYIFDKTIAINTRGPLLVTKYAARSMIRVGKGGSIVNISSQAGLVGLAGHLSYGASKAALDSITRVSALELGRYGIRVNSVNPTAVLTEMSVDYWGRPDIGGPFLEKMPLGRFAAEEEIAAPVAFLLSDGAAMITGVSLPVDGGFTSC